MSYIKAYSTISKASSDTKGLIKGIMAGEKGENGAVLEPVYKDLINPMAVRRMSRIVKMGVYTALQAIQENEVGGIVHATGLGCLADTQRFLDVIDQAGDGALSPTAFIQSTHNTIAGQIALLKKIQAYNMTHVQNGISFESALIDALCLAAETPVKIMIGAADETAPILDELMNHYQVESSLFSYGASSFLIGAEKGDSNLKITSCEVKAIQGKLDVPDADLVLYGNSFFSSKVAEIEGIDYSKYSGIFHTNSAFGLQLACELLLAPSSELKFFNIVKQPTKIAVLNNYLGEHQGTVVVEKV